MNRGRVLSRAFGLLSLLALSASAFGQTQANLDQTNFVTNDGVVYAVDPANTFTVQHPGHFRGRVTFTTQNFDPVSGQFVAPNLATLWSVRNSDFKFIGDSEWLGDDGNQAPMPLLSFDPSTGIGQAQLDIPMAHYIGEWSYAPLPQGPTTLLFVFGEHGQLSRNAAGVPINFQHYSTFGFTTDYPEILTCVDNEAPSVGERMQITVILADTAPYDMSLAIDIVGTGKFQLEDGGPINHWNLTLPKGTCVYALDVFAREEGTCYARATRSDGVQADGPWVQIGPQRSAVVSTKSGFSDGRGADAARAAGQQKECIPGACAPVSGDQEMNCTRPFVELVETPINPSCPGPNVGIVIDGGCRGEEGGCTEATATITCPKYKYAGTVDRSCGQVEVGAKIGVEGQMNWLIVKAKTNVEFHTTTMSPITRRCCKYTPAPGESANVKVKCCN